MKFNFLNRKIKSFMALCLVLSLLLSLVGCSGKEEKRYQTYIKSLIAINYLGATEDYIEATGANQEDADALYDSNIELLTDNLLAYYRVNIDHAPEMREAFKALSKTIYSKVNYKVSPARKDGSVYLVDVTIYPIMLFSQTANDVITYINVFNDRVAAGDFNDYELPAYETEFAAGLIQILDEACITMQYGDPVTVTVEIIEDGDKFYISDRDFLSIDNAMIDGTVEVPATTESTEESVQE